MLRGCRLKGVQLGLTLRASGDCWVAAFRAMFWNIAHGVEIAAFRSTTHSLKSSHRSLSSVQDFSGGSADYTPWISGLGSKVEGLLIWLNLETILWLKQASLKV